MGPPFNISESSSTGSREPRLSSVRFRFDGRVISIETSLDLRAIGMDPNEIELPLEDERRLRFAFEGLRDDEACGISKAE